MIDALRHSAAHAFVDQLETPVLSPTDEHHLSRVLRLRDGETVTVSDGRGRYRTCAWANGEVRATGDIVVVPADASRIGVAFVPVKGDRHEWTVQKLTEIGVDEIVLVAPTRRSVVRWSDADKQLRKLAIVAREAAMQSRRVWLPTVSGPTALGELCARPEVAIADPDGAPLATAHAAVLRSASATGVSLVVVGPEGGFDDDEIPGSVPRVSLGDTILRAETATLVAATMLSVLRSSSRAKDNP